MVALDTLVVVTALNTIRLHLGASIEQLEWTVNAYTIAVAVLLMTGAAFGDRFGRRRLFMVGVALFTLASAACALAPSINWLIAARAVEGAGGALIMPLAATLVSEAFPPQQRGRALGLFSATAGLAVLLGPVIGGAVAQGLSWQWIFWLNVPIGVVALPLISLHIDESYGEKKPLDIVGLLLATGATLGLMLGLVRGNGAGWGSLEVLGTLVAGVLFGGAFVWWEARTAHPMLPMRLFRSRAFSAGNAAAFLFFASLYGSTFFLSQFLQTGQGDGPFEAGARLLPMTAVLFLAAPTSGALINRLGERRIMAVAMLSQGIGMGLVALIARPDVPYIALLAPLVIAGLGSAAIPSSQNVVINAVAPREIGKASGTFNMLRQLGGAFGVAIAAAVFARYGTFHSPQAFTLGFAPAMWSVAVIGILGSVIALALPRKRMVNALTEDVSSRAKHESQAVGTHPLSA